MSASLSEESLKEKANYSITRKWEPFYTGGNVQASKENAHIICCCGSEIKLVDRKTGICDKVIQHNGDDVTSFIITPNKEHIIAATRSLLLKQWSYVDTIKCQRTWKAIHTSPVLCMDVEKSSTLLATGGSDGTIKVWDLVRQYCTHNLQLPAAVVSVVKFHPTELMLYSASSDYEIRAWNLNTAKTVATLHSHVSTVTSILFPADDIMISSGKDNVVCLWKLDSGVSSEPYKTIPTFESVDGLVVLPQMQYSYTNQSNDGFNFVTAGSDGVLRVWNTESGQCLFKTNKEKQSVEFVSILPLLTDDGTGDLVVTTSDNSINFVDVATLEVKQRFAGNIDEVLGVKLLGKERKTHIAIITNSSAVRVFRIDSSDFQLLSGHDDTVTDLDVFSNGVGFVSTSKDGVICVWNMDENGKVVCTATGQGHSSTITSVAVSQMAVDFIMTGSQDCTMKLWRLGQTKKSALKLKAEHSVLAHGMTINSIHVSPNDKLIATGSQDKLVKLWKVDQLEKVTTFAGHKKSVWCVQFSPLDKIVASSSADGSIKVWSIVNLTCVRTIEGHDCSVLLLIFIKRGTQIASAGSDGLVKFWDMKTSDCVQTLDEHDEKVWGLCAADDGDAIFTGSSDGSFVRWTDTSGQVALERAQQREHDAELHQELQNLLHEKKIEKALRLAVRLEQPGTALKILKELPCDASVFERALGRLSAGKAAVLLDFVVQWNANSRNCHEAQALLQYLLSTFTADELLTFRDAGPNVRALIAYTERHFERLTRLSHQAAFLDYTYHQINFNS